jgi:hypothetical protein
MQLTVCAQEAASLSLLRSSAVCYPVSGFPAPDRGMYERGHTQRAIVQSLPPPRDHLHWVCGLTCT